MSGRAPQTQDKYILRLPDGLRERIAEHAKANGRSMNAEIVRLLEINYPPPPSVDDMLRDIEVALALSDKPGSARDMAFLAEKLRDLRERIENEQTHSPPK